MKRVLVIGIGAGDPDYITVQAIKALNQVDVFFVADKGSDKGDLNALRRDVCERHITDHTYRMVEFPPGKRDNPAETYRSSIDICNDNLEKTYERLLAQETQDGECAGFLVWGDPSLYDSTLRLLNRIKAKGTVDFEFEVIPGISSVQALAARHKVALNEVSNSVEITTGRKLSQHMPEKSSVVVMLDSEGAYRTLPDQDMTIYWGAYVGSKDELLISGKLRDVSSEIDRIRAAARDRKGWIMDTYLLKREE